MHNTALFSGVGGISQVTVASVCVLMRVEMRRLCFYANPEFA